MIGWFSTACCLYGPWGAFIFFKAKAAPRAGAGAGGWGRATRHAHAARSTHSWHSHPHSHPAAPRAMGAGDWGTGVRFLVGQSCSLLKIKLERDIA
jgi:hypothetical protein